MHKVFFPLELKEDPRIVEFLEEITLASASGFKSKHDDCIDTISMLGSLNLWKPSVTNEVKPVEGNVYAIPYEDTSDEILINSYFC